MRPLRRPRFPVPSAPPPGGRGRKRRQRLVGTPGEPVGDIEAMRGRQPCRGALCRMGCGRRGPGVLRRRGARSGAAVRTVGIRSVRPGGRPVMTRPREARAVVRSREGVRRTVRPDECRAERVMRAVVPPSGQVRTTEVAVRRPVREARKGIRHPGEARRQLREARRRPGTAGVTMVAPARSVIAATERTTVGRKVVGPVLVEPVLIGSGLVLRIVVGLIARAGEVRGAVDRCAPPVRGRSRGSSYRNGQDDGGHQQTGGNARTETWSDHSAPPVPSRRVTSSESHVMRFTASRTYQAGYPTGRGRGGPGRRG